MGFYKRLISGAMCICLSAALFTGCSDKNTDTNVDVADSNVTEAGALPVVKEKVTLTFGVPGTSKVQDYKTNEFTKYIEEKTGVELKFYEFPSSGGMEKLNVMLASGSELPDVICGFNIPNSTFLKHDEDGTFLDLTPYIEKYGYWINQMKEKSMSANFDGFMTAANGKKYFVPASVEQTGNMYGRKAFINKAWLDKLGLDMPETVDDFRKCMQAFVTKDPNGNGKNDELGFTGSKDGWNEKPINFLMNSFVYDDYEIGAIAENGKLTLNYTTDAYKEGLKYISEMVANKEIDIQCYTQDNATLRALCSADDLTVGAFASGGPDGLFSGNMERLKDYVALPPLKGPKGVAYASMTEPTVFCAAAITKYCKNPAAAFRVLDFMLSEEASTFARFGIEGKDWKKVDESTPAMFASIGAKAKILPILEYDAIQNSHWHQYNPLYAGIDMMDGMAWNGNPLDPEYVKAAALPAYIGKGPKEIFRSSYCTLSADDQEIYDELASEVKAYVKEEIPKFVSGSLNVDKDWATFQKELKNLNVDEYLKLMQKGYDAFKSNSK